MRSSRMRDLCKSFVLLWALLAANAHAQAGQAQRPPQWPTPVHAPAGAPNVLVILLDDAGFADSSTFGGLIQTPELDRLASQGVRYSNFNTAALCSPSRAALLTGRNHHRAGFGLISQLAAGLPGYNSVWQRDTASVAEVLRRNGFSTAAFGKWHNTPLWELGPTGPFDRWPTGLGFEYFYGSMAGMDSQWEPGALYRNTTPVEAPASAAEGYQLTADIADEAIRWMNTHASVAGSKPYFLYFAPSGPHMPHQAPRDWIERYRGRFDRGWDVLRQEIFERQRRLGVIPANAELTPRPDSIAAWDTLSDDQKRLYARQMEVYAGYLAYTDYEVGRVVRAAQALPSGNNTLIFYIAGDNGPYMNGPDGEANYSYSAQGQIPLIDELGSPNVSWNNYAGGWAWLGATPFRYWKFVASHFGGLRAPLVVSWPARMRALDRVRFQFAHVNDIAATIYEAAGVQFPRAVDGVRQEPLDGVSFAATFNDPNHTSQHRTQYFEILGNRAIYHDGWMASAAHFTELGYNSDTRGFNNFADDRWELFRVDQDFTQAHDLASQYPRRLAQLQRLFDREARANDVYPLAGGVNFRRGAPSITQGQSVFVYHEGIPRLSAEAAPPLSGRSYRITASLIVPTHGARGVIASYGGRESGFALYVEDNHLIYENHIPSGARTLIRLGETLPTGNVVVGVEFVHEATRRNPGESVPTSTGVIRLSVNARVVDERRLATVLDGFGRIFGVGRAYGGPVSTRFDPPFPFTGELREVRVELLN